MLSEKYRPAKFSDLVGQEANTAVLKHIVRNRGKKPPLLFTGPFGSGKTSVSRILAKALVCQNITPDSEPCCECQSCIDFQEGRNVNYTEMDAATNGDAESIRNLREVVSYSAMNSHCKVTNIDEAHNITKVGYNALLKQLEESSEHHVFMFCTNEPDKMLDTVRSRCQRIHILSVKAEDVFKHLSRIAKTENIETDEDALQLLAAITAPHIRDAINTLEFLSYKGRVAKSDVEEYFQITSHNLFLELLITVGTNISRALEILGKLTEEFDTDVIYRKLLDLCLAIEAQRRGASVNIGYVDPTLFSIAVQQSYDYLSVSSFLLKVEKPLDTLYLKYLIMELHRVLNHESMPVYGNPPVIRFENNQPINPTPEGSVENKKIEESSTPIINEESGSSAPQLNVSSGKPKQKKAPLKIGYPDQTGSNTGVLAVTASSMMAKAASVETKEPVLTNKRQQLLTKEEFKQMMSTLK